MHQHSDIKKRIHKSNLAERASATSERKETNLTVLEFYRTGRLVQKRVDEYSPEGRRRRGAAIVKRLSTELSLPIDLLYKARDFAEQFSKSEAKALNQMSLTKSHVTAVLKLEEKDEQLELLNKASENSWSVKTLRAKVRARAGVRSFGGRDLRERSITELVHEVRLVCRQIVGYVNQLEDQDFWRMPERTVQKLMKIRAHASWLHVHILEE